MVQELILFASFINVLKWQRIYLKSKFVFVRKICILLSSKKFSMKTGLSRIDFDVIFPIQSSFGNKIFRYNFPDSTSYVKYTLRVIRVRFCLQFFVYSH